MEKKGVHGIQECAGHRDCRRRCGKGGGEEQGGGRRRGRREGGGGKEMPGPDLPPRAALAEGASQNAAGGAARRPPGPAGVAIGQWRRAPLLPEVPRPRHPQSLRCGGTSGSASGRGRGRTTTTFRSVHPCCSLAAQRSQQPGSSDQDQSARQATIPGDGNPQPVPDRGLADPTSRPQQASILPARRPPAAKHVASGGQDSAGRPPPRARAHPAAVLGFRRHSRRPVIAQAGRAGRAGRGDRKPHPPSPLPSRALHAAAAAVRPS